MCVSEDGATVRCGVTTNFQGEDRNNGLWYVQCLPGFRFLQFYCFFGYPCGFLTSFRACLLFSCLTLLLRFVL